MLSGFREPRRTSTLRSAPRDISRTASRTASEAKSRLSTASDEFSRSAEETTDRTRRGVRQFGERIRQGTSDLADSTADYGAGARRAAHDLRDSISGAARSGYDRMADSASEAYESATERAHEVMDSISQTASEMRDNVANAGNSFARVLREQPLVLAGLGLAIGGLLGAFLPTTELEDKVMGSASDQVKDKVREAANETLDKGKAVADRAWQEAREEAADQGLLPLNQDGSDIAGTSKPEKNEPEASLVPQDQERGEQVRGGA
jgi:hypothetical protein